MRVGRAVRRWWDLTESRCDAATKKLDNIFGRDNEEEEEPAPANPPPSAGRGKRSKEKKKSNMELFKEQLKREQEQREQRMAGAAPLSGGKSLLGLAQSTAAPASTYKAAGPTQGSYDSGDPTTTNLYVGNLSTEIHEDILVKEL